MSYEEHWNLVPKAEKEGKYCVFVIDGIGHRKYYSYDSFEKNYLENSAKMLLNVAMVIRKLEKETNKKIIVEDENTIVIDTIEKFISRFQLLRDKNESLDALNPFFDLGDLGCLTVYRDSISGKEFCSLLQAEIKNMNLSYQYRFYELPFETTDRSEAGAKLHRTYAVSLAEKLARDNQMIISAEGVEMKSKKGKPAPPSKLKPFNGNKKDREQ